MEYQPPWHILTFPTGHKLYLGTYALNTFIFTSFSDFLHTLNETKEG